MVNEVLDMCTLTNKESLRSQHGSLVHYSADLEKVYPQFWCPEDPAPTRLSEACFFLVLDAFRYLAGAGLLNLPPSQSSWPPISVLVSNTCPSAVKPWRRNTASLILALWQLRASPWPSSVRFLKLAPIQESWPPISALVSNTRPSAVKPWFRNTASLILALWQLRASPWPSSVRFLKLPPSQASVAADLRALQRNLSPRR